MTFLRHSQKVKPEPRQAGFFGKLPMRGDFVTRRLDSKLRGVLDQWLSASITASRLALGDGWEAAYHHAPIWRFVFSAGVAGPEPVAGILMPSADNHGRQFPLVIAVEMPGCVTPLRLILGAEAWFVTAELAARSCLAEGANFEVFDRQVLALGQPAFASDGAVTARRFDFTNEADRARAYTGALEATLSGRQTDVTVWWTRAAGRAASLLHHQGLPAPDRFAALLDGQWKAWGWSREIPVPDEAPSALASGKVSQLRSAARSHRGPRGGNNEDATLEQSSLGLWAVADGAGDHTAGARASSTLIAKLGEFQQAMSFGSALTEIEELLGEANEALRTIGRQLGPEHICASVIVTLFVHNGQYVVIWAGDSRAYLHREGRLQLLTHDHVSDGGRYVTRAIGAEDMLHVDVVRGDVLPADRFILCSEGLVKAIGDPMLEAAAASRGTPTEVANELIENALIAGAPYNVTVLVVDVMG